MTHHQFVTMKENESSFLVLCVIFKGIIHWASFFPSPVRCKGVVSLASQQHHHGAFPICAGKASLRTQTHWRILIMHCTLLLLLCSSAVFCYSCVVEKSACSQYWLIWLSYFVFSSFFFPPLLCTEVNVHILSTAKNTFVLVTCAKTQYCLIFLIFCSTFMLLNV